MVALAGHIQATLGMDEVCLDTPVGDGDVAGTLTVDTEAMQVRHGFGGTTLTVDRTAPTTHKAGAAATYASTPLAQSANVPELAYMLWSYRFATGTSGDPGSGHLLLDNADPTLATLININDTSFDNVDLTRQIILLASGERIIVQDAGNAANYQLWHLGADPVDHTTYYTLGTLTLAGSGGTGTTGFANQLKLVVMRG